jgi:transposase
VAVAWQWRATAREEGDRENERLRQEIERLRRELERSEREREQVERERDRLREERDRLEKELEAARRAAKRQAAPFSKGAPHPSPRRPGRKPGAAYGRRAWRAVPEHVDEVVEVLPPPKCAACGGEIAVERIDVQHQTDLPPVQPHVTAFHVHVGRCRRCGRRAQGRDARQTSTARGAAASQVGPRALAWAAWLHTGLGVPFAKVATILRTGFGLTITPGGLVQALHRVGERTGPTYQALVAAVQRSPVVAPDETGWKVGGRLWWLWVFVTRDVTVYAIQPGRGYVQAAAILGSRYRGIVVRDGWAPYRKLPQATHQTCLALLADVTKSGKMDFTSLTFSAGAVSERPSS